MRRREKKIKIPGRREMRRRYRPTDLDTIQISFAGRPATQWPLLCARILSVLCCTFNRQSFTHFSAFLPRRWFLEFPPKWPRPLLPHIWNETAVRLNPVFAFLYVLGCRRSIYSSKTFYKADCSIRLFTACASRVSTTERLFSPCQTPKVRGAFLRSSNCNRLSQTHKHRR